MFERLTSHHSINNLVWVWSSPEPDWYPGNIRVDLLGFDSYPGSYNYDCQSATYAKHTQVVQSQKMVQMTENGPIPDMENCLRQGIKWGLFLSWSDLVFSQNSMDHIHAVYKSPAVLTLTHLLMTDSYVPIPAVSRNPAMKTFAQLRKHQ